MIRLKKYAYQSSFWLWFVVALIVNQALLFSIYYFVLIRPVTDTMAQAVGVFVATAAQVDHDDSVNGLIKLQKSAARFPAITFTRDDENIEEIPRHFLGLRIMRETLQRQLGEEAVVGYAPQPNQALVVKIQGKQPLTLRISFKGRFFALQIIGTSILLLIVISVFAAFWISARLVRPLQVLSEEAIRLEKEQTVREISVPSKSSPEIAQLAITLNKMQSALDVMMKERETLLAGVAHDLRTPLSRMRLALELEGAGKNELIDGLRDDAIEMGAVMEQFIELSRLNLEVEEAWVEGDINALVQEIAAKYRRVGIHLTLNLTEGLPSVQQKPLALARLLNNLIDNAYRHGNGMVTVKTYLTAGQVAIAVVNPDPGTGENTGLMLALSQGPSSGAAGLGLSIVRRFAEVHAATLRETIAGGERTYTLIFGPGWSDA